MLIRKIGSCFTIANFYVKSARFFCFHDRNFEHFRNKAEYKNLIVQPVQDLNQSKAQVISEVKPFAIEVDDGFFYHLLQRENVMKLSPLQVKDILSILANSKFDVIKYASVLKFLDEKCALSAERWPLDLSFYILDAWLIILGPKIFRKHYYSAITSQWSRKIQKCSKSNLILVLYFIGLSKSEQPFILDSVLYRMENILSEFSNEEIAIACLSFFKCSKKVKSIPFLQRSCQAAEQLLQINDQFNAISILKCLRLSKYYDAQFYECVKNYVMENYSTFNLVVCSNFLALFATQNVYSQDLFNVLEVQAIATLGEEVDRQNLKTHPSLRSRAKDLARFMWALTTVGHPVKEDTLICITHHIEKRIRLGEYESQLPVLVDSLQSFVLANHYPIHIFSSSLSPLTYKRICNCDKAKPKYQLYFVEKSTIIEHPEIPVHTSNMTHTIPKHLEKEIRERKGFKEILAFLNQSFPSCLLRSCYVMPHIMIAGILFSLKLCKPYSSVADHNPIFKNVISKQVQDIIKNYDECICFEILDSSVCTGKSNHVAGLMQTKIRQLKKLNLKVVALSTDQINALIRTNVLHDCNIDKFFQEHFV